MCNIQVNINTPSNCASHLIPQAQHEGGLFMFPKSKRTQCFRPTIEANH